MIRCIAIDDEPLALTQITGYIGKTPFLELEAACPSALEAVKALAVHRVDLLFVDINMPDLSGLDFVRSLPDRPLVIFTTAYSEYAIEGFRVDAVDYLLKPIGYPDFLRAAEKARRQYQLRHAAQETGAETPGRIFVKSDYKQVRIDIADMLYLESQSEYVRIHVSGGKPVMTLGSLRSFEERLPRDRFLRIHRSYIVNLRHIAAVERNVVLIGGVRIPVGEQFREQFRAYLEENTFGK